MRAHVTPDWEDMPELTLKWPVTIGLAALASACSTAAPTQVVLAPPPPPPPPQIVTAPPTMPRPPMGAATGMTVPVMGIDGVRNTVNYNLDPVQTLWHFRSAFNVAALNCQSPAHFRIADDYNLFIKLNEKTLAATNRTLESRYREQFGPDYRRVRDTHSTQVYNYFALPPVKSDFCDAALRLGQEAVLTPPEEITSFAMVALPQLEMVFDRFYQAYERYEQDLVMWNALYGDGEPLPLMIDGQQINNGDAYGPVIESRSTAAGTNGGAAFTQTPTP